MDFQRRRAEIETTKDKYLKIFLDKMRKGDIFYKDGNICRSLKTRKEFKKLGRINTKGYVQLTGCENGKEITCMAHRLIFAYFNNLPFIPTGMEIDHKNGVKNDNRIENLEMVTPGENQKRAYRLGLKKVYENRDEKGRFIK